MNRVQNAKIILWIIVGFAAAVALNRFIFGLGVTTNLNDYTPWGLWIGFDVMGGVALAAGGFVITAIVYIMRQEKFRPLVKPAVLTAFLGYIAVILGLLVDLGLPWNIWHMIIYWNPHSPLFEVGWCVMLYTSVLLLEFSPVPLEKYSRYARIRNFLMKFRFVFVLLGIMLSTLHQSSLGTLFLIMPFKIYPLWYSNLLPIEFFISAIALGLMMVAFESIVSHWLYKREPETEIVAKLCKAVVWVLSLYFGVKIVDIIATDKFAMIFNGSWQSNLFIFEVLISTIIPVIIFIVPKFYENYKFQWIGSSMVIFGILLNRIDVGGLVMLGATGGSYTPAWTEITISLGIISLAVLVFLFMIENFQVWEIQPKEPDSLLSTLPSFDYSSRTWLGTPNAASLIKHSFAFVLSFAIGMALMSGKQLHAKGIYDIKVSYATAMDSLSDTLCINGNRDNQFVIFSHQAHISLIGKDSCFVCHHLSMPGEKLSNCWECHTSMYTAVNFFNHDLHAFNKEANLKCDDCHKPGVYRDAQSAKKCTNCHLDYRFSSNERDPAKEYYALSYTDAMHKLCVSCHLIQSKIIKDKSYLAQCSTCHKTQYSNRLSESIKWDIRAPHFNSVILPDISIKGKK